VSGVRCHEGTRPPATPVALACGKSIDSGDHRFAHAGVSGRMTGAADDDEFPVRPSLGKLP
jgi:hypothetical protein